VNDDDARQNVLLQLALAHDRFVDTERMHRRREEHALAEGAHRITTWLLRAYAAERDNPQPQGDTLRHVGP
jgi:hypothetical protein